MHRALITLLIAAAAPFASAATPSPEASVLRVNVTSQAYNFRLPWQKTSPTSQSSLGALIGDNNVLVTAEIVANATYVEIEKPASGEKLTAKVLEVDYEANLALVGALDDAPEFFDGLVPLEVTAEAEKGDTLSVWQFENNGSSVSTDLTLEAFDMGNYFLDSSYFLIYEAAGTLQYRDGSYSIPVVRDGKLAGLLIDYSSDDELSDILPGPIIKHFLDDLATPPYSGFPNFGIKYSQTLDTQLRKFAKLGDRSGGILVSAVLPDTSAEKSGVQQGDVIIEINGHPIDSRGNYNDPKYGLMSIAHMVKGDVSTGDTIPVKILRDGKELTLQVTLIRKEPQDYLIDPYMYDRAPRYLIMGGMLFQELTLDYLKTAGSKWRTRAPFKLVYAHSHQQEYEKQGREKLVFLSGTLPTRSALGYERLGTLIVTKVNDKTINNIRDLDAAFSEVPENGIHKIEFNDYPHVAYLDHAAATVDNEQLLPARYQIHQLKRLD